MDIGRLEPVPLRELWQHEAYGLTAWLSENLDLLGSAIGADLTLVSTGCTDELGALTADFGSGLSG